MKELEKIFKNPSAKCPKCKDEIPWDTHGKHITCSCGYLSVDGDGLIVRIITRRNKKAKTTRK